MNKLLIVLLAVCLVSTHAFVKRDAPAAQSDLQKQIDEARTKLEEFTKNITDQTSKAFDLDVMKKNLLDAITAAQQALEKLKPTPAAAETKAA